MYQDTGDFSETNLNGGFMTIRFFANLKAKGWSGVLFFALRKLFPTKIRGYSLYREIFIQGKGLEIGGPSGAFGKNGVVPIYPDAEILDNCNYSHDTIWEGKVREGRKFQFYKGKEAGFQYVAEASDLRDIPDKSYDYVLSSHCLEHLANPLKGLSEWMRVLKEEGVLVLVVPDKEKTFDHRRPVTTLDHLIQDFEANTGEDDLTHLQEILNLHDFDKDPNAGGREEFEARSKMNFSNRCLHHHTFNMDLVVDLARHANLRILQVEKFRPYHIVLIGKKISASAIFSSPL